MYGLRGRWWMFANTSHFRLVVSRCSTLLYRSHQVLPLPTTKTWHPVFTSTIVRNTSVREIGLYSKTSIFQGWKLLMISLDIGQSFGWLASFERNQVVLSLLLCWEHMCCFLFFFNFELTDYGWGWRDIHLVERVILWLSVIKFFGML